MFVVVVKLSVVVETVVIIGGTSAALSIVVARLNIIYRIPYSRLYWPYGMLFLGTWTLYLANVGMSNAMTDNLFLSIAIAFSDVLLQTCIMAVIVASSGKQLFVRIFCVCRVGCVCVFIMPVWMLFRIFQWYS